MKPYDIIIRDSYSNFKICQDTIIIDIGPEKKCLNLSLLLEEDDLAPLFSGTAWAGTIIWDAAIFLSNFFLLNYIKSIKTPNYNIIEIGAGIGLPGMIASIYGANSVILTEEKKLLKLLKNNINTNFLNNNNTNAIQVYELSWGIENTNHFINKLNKKSIDFIFCCDCIYEPLYGKSWKLLSDTICILIKKYPNSKVLLSVERRNQDGIDSFLNYSLNQWNMLFQLTLESIGKTDNILQLYTINSNI